MKNNAIIKSIFVIFMCLFAQHSYAENYSGLITNTIYLNALSLSEGGRHKEAIEMTEGNPATDDKGEYYFVLALLQSKYKDRERAAGNFRLAYLYSSDDAIKEAALFERAALRLDMLFYQEARAGFIIFIKTYPKSSLIKHAHAGLAQSLLGMGYLQDASQYYDMAGDIPEAKFGKAALLNIKGRHEDADKLYQSAIKDNPTYLESSNRDIYYYGENLRMMGRTMDARQKLSEVSSGMYKEMAEISLGQIALGESKIDEALIHFRDAADSISYDLRASALFFISKAYAQAGRLADAELELSDLRGKYPYAKIYDEAVIELSRLQWRSGRYDDAIGVLKELVFRISPKKEALDEFEYMLNELSEINRVLFLKYWDELGKWLYDKSRENLIARLMIALKEDGRPYTEHLKWLYENGSPLLRTVAAFEFASVYVKAGSPERARGFLKEVKSDKGIEEQYNRLNADIDYSLGKHQQALNSMMKFKELNPADYVRLASIARALKNPGKALGFYAASLEKSNAGAEAYLFLADYYFSRGKKEEAKTYYDLGLIKDPLNEWAMHRATLLLEDPADALQKLSQSSSIYGREAKGRLKMIELNQKMDDMFDKTASRGR